MTQGAMDALDAPHMSAEHGSNPTVYYRIVHCTIKAGVRYVSQAAISRLGDSVCAAPLLVVIQYICQPGKREWVDCGLGAEARIRARRPRILRDGSRMRKNRVR